ncbi:MULTISPECIES: lysylphosphatidylglycerol synthase transmembrane domain-containing protein [unclassified Lentimonas]|uniref:lysylphosphatidylglycerol synthase transmembrane domain-containing protein n=1 Tax=unclassified Lentimonas TaxID=2630993 RepID=UPI001322E570|nr:MULTISPECIES: lysylphosphatidylglycerol synthase transmembrane domain-containing protein [unclassified Lentimonas]CAA6691138.1 Unannotated [Lentimonas sp. CC10]CAA6693758.1 Unannotated [Lentimonas sp. CC19]CAA7070128.1 Unannotated [Lentimonas sp. CC11]
MKKRSAILRWSLLLLLLFGLTNYVITHLEQFKVIRQISFRVIGFMLLLHASTLIIAGFRYLTLVRSFDLQITFSAWFRIFIYTRFLNRFYPQGGSIYRAVALKSDYGFSISNYVTAFAAYSYLDRLFALVFTFLLVLLVEPSLKLLGVNVALLLSSILIAAIVPIFLFQHKTNSPLKSQGRISRSIHKFKDMLSELTKCMRKPYMLATFALTGLLSFSISLTMSWLCFRELGDPIQLSQISVLSYIKSTFNTIPLTPGNLGTTETAYGLLSAGMNTSPATAILVATINNICAITSVSAVCAMTLLLVKKKTHASE